MSLIIKGRGSKSLAGAASLKHRMPVVGDCFHVYRYSSEERATDSKSVIRRFDSCYRLQGAENTRKQH